MRIAGGVAGLTLRLSPETSAIAVLVVVLLTSLAGALRGGGVKPARHLDIRDFSPRCTASARVTAQGPCPG